MRSANNARAMRSGMSLRMTLGTDAQCRDERCAPEPIEQHPSYRSSPCAREWCPSAEADLKRAVATLVLATSRSATEAG